MLPHLFLHIKGRRGEQKDKRVKERQGRSEGLQSFKYNSNTPSLLSDPLFFLLSTSHICLIVPPLTNPCFHFCVYSYFPLSAGCPPSVFLMSSIQPPYLIWLSLSGKKKKSGLCSDTNPCPMSSLSLNLYIFFLSCLTHATLLLLSSLPCDRYCSYRLSIGIVL